MRVSKRRERVETTLSSGNKRKTRKQMRQSFKNLDWKNIRKGLKEFDWSPYREPRFVVAASTAAAFLIVSGGYIHWNMTRTQSWTEVFTNGTLVGVVPAKKQTLSQMQRTAEGYDVKLKLSPVHQYVPASYNWYAVTQLPESAYAISLNGQPLVYTSSSVAAHSVINSVESTLVPKNISSDATIKLDGNVVIHKTVIGVADVLSAPDAVDYILHPSAGQVIASRSASPLVAPPPSLTHNISLTPVVKTSVKTATKASHPLINVMVSQVVQKKVHVRFPVKKIKSNRLGIGSVQVSTRGVDGVNQETIQQSYKDGKLVSQKILKKDVLSKPKEQVEYVGINAGVFSGSWVWPSPDYDITSPYGPRILFGRWNFHPGVDIGCPIGTPIYATNNGVVEDAGWNNGGYGIWVKINNGRGIETIFGHMSRVAVHAGQTVAKGQIIGYSGETGFATGPHLHYEVRLYGQHINPAPYM